MLWLQGLACGALATLATPTAVLAGLLLGPGLLALALDQTPGRPTARPILLLGLATTLQPVAELWQAGHRIGSALDLIADPRVLATAWLAQVGGWVLVELGPLLLALALEAGAQARMVRLRAIRARYEALWDIPPVDAPMAQDAPGESPSPG
ncbi:hypothetical protein [Limobrevibacterium gyesilva]|uniref:Uncharacterized protein n=1 Tax=Limobrevibacterium gyesilva TaxID=2991712 RepID=A0AA41YJW4_9PROT|nr:hypothetical protein [Limobrevibacterium gyesilva]MCW3473940.1 hypothetical protein [Limobrevibacterium gyesilva]